MKILTSPIAVSLTIVLSTLSFGTGVVKAQSLCADRAQVVSMLQGQYGESVRGIGLANQNRIIEIFASEETGTWTITMTMPNGVTCLLASGRHYEEAVVAPPGDPL